MPRRIIRDPRYSFIVLVLLSAILAFIAVMVSLKAINDSQHKWCQVVNSIVSVPVPQPTGPRVDPKQERAWEFYQEFVDLKRSLGC
jgi:hypothetical protein